MKTSEALRALAKQLEPRALAEKALNEQAGIIEQVVMVLEMHEEGLKKYGYKVYSERVVEALKLLGEWPTPI